jgi:N-acetylmuramoyl-L-alanine amidase
MSNSKLATKTIWNPNHSGQRKEPITKIAIHHMAGVLDVETCAKVLANNLASANYLIGSDGTVCINVDEANRSWCTASSWCDNRAVTIEVSNSKAGGNWPVSDKVLEKLIELCVDICQRNGIKECTYTGNQNGTLQMHKWYMATACPGPYLASKFPYIAKEVTKRLQAKAEDPKKPLYKVQLGAFKSFRNAKNLEEKVNKALNLKSYVFLENSLYKVQAGAFADLTNAQNLSKKLKDKGFDNFITGQELNRKSIKQLAKEVLKGDWGNGAERREQLEKAGYDYDKVQDEVNRLLRG